MASSVVFKMHNVELEVGDMMKLDGELLEIVKITPHQDIKGSFYYEFHNENNDKKNCIRRNNGKTYKYYTRIIKPFT